MDTLKHLKIFNQIYKEMDIVYHGYAKTADFRIWRTGFFIRLQKAMNILRSVIFAMIGFFAPQTVNSAERLPRI